MISIARKASRILLVLSAVVGCLGHVGYAVLKLHPEIMLSHGYGNPAYFRIFGQAFLAGFWGVSLFILAGIAYANLTILEWEQQAARARTDARLTP